MIDNDFNYEAIFATCFQHCQMRLIVQGFQNFLIDCDLLCFISDNGTLGGYLYTLNVEKRCKEKINWTRYWQQLPRVTLTRC